MKNLIMTLTVVLFCYAINAQDKKSKDKLIQGPKSVVKTNVVSLAFTSLNVTYEFKAGQNITVGTLLGYKLPQTLKIEAIGDINKGEDPYQYVGEIEPEGLFVSPFMRIYTKEAMKGFYIETFLRYYNYNYLLPYEYEKNGKILDANAKGEADGFGGGLSFGTQFALSPAFVMDIFAGFGAAIGSTHIETSDDRLDIEDFLEIQRSIQENADTPTEVNIPFYGALMDAVEAGANDKSAWVDIENVPFPILRFGISLGYTF